MSLFQPAPIRSLAPLKRFGLPIDTAPAASATPDHRLPDASLRWRRLGWPVGWLALALLTRLWWLQIVHGQMYRQRADVNRVRTISVPAPRGTIIDRDGVVLAENIPNFVLSIIPADLPRETGSRVAALEAASRISARSVADILKQLSAVEDISTDPVPIREQIASEEALNLMVETTNQPWITVTATPSRRYPDGAALAHLLGYVGAVTAEDIKHDPAIPRNQTVGKAGLEQSYNAALTGQDGYRDVERNVRHQAQRVLAEQPPQAGRTLQLTVDAALQTHLFGALESSVKRVHSRAGAAVALDPKTGAVRAMVSYPSYDDNTFVALDLRGGVGAILQDDRRPLLNRAIAGQYPSGSIIKPMLATAGLQERVVTPSTIIQSTGGIQIGRDSFPDWKAGGHGATNLSKAIAESVNTYFYILGGGDETRTGLGVDRMVQYLSEFGWGSRLGVDLPGETAGLLPTRQWRTEQRLSPWRLGDTYHLAIGQGDLLVTPLQVAAAVTAIVNNGMLYQPYVVDRIASVPPQVTKPKPIRRLNVEPQYFAAVRDGMRQGVLTGSSRALGSLPVAAAAKTGTAQFGRDGRTHAWFAAFAPYDDPELVIVVIVEGGGEGHAAALPVAQETLQWYFSQPQRK